MKQPTSKVAFGVLILFLTSVGAFIDASLSRASRAASREAITVRKASRGNSPIRFQNGRDLPAQYTAAGLTAGENLLALEQRQVRALSLASGDVNRDGYPDLICGYAGVGAGLVTVQLGNAEAYGPTKPETIQSIIQRDYPDPFLSETAVLSTPEAPEFLATGDFDRDGHLDIIAGTRGSGALYLLAGDENHGFQEPRAVPLPGVLTTMTARQKTQGDSWAALVVGIVGQDGPALVVYPANQKIAAEAALTYPLPAEATFATLGQLDDDSATDVAIIAGERLYILHGPVDQATKYGSLPDEHAGQLEPIALPFGVKAAAISDFIWDRDARMELAVAAEDGTVQILRRGALDTRPFTVEEMQARRQLAAEVERGDRPMSDLSRARMGQALTWEVAERTSMTLGHAENSAQPLLISTVASGSQSHALLVVNPGARQLQMGFREDARPGQGAEAGERNEITLDADSEPVAALPMRLNAHAQPGLVVLRQGQPEPVIVVVEANGPMNVNTAADTDDAVPGDGTCADSAGNCSLRAAIQEANAADDGFDMITFSSALNGVPIQLTQAGNDNTAAQGDLDINSDLSIVGNGAGNTIIQASSNAAFSANMGDKIFSINPDGTSSLRNVTLSGLTVRFTRNDNTGSASFGGALDIFLSGTGEPGMRIFIDNCTFDSNATQNGRGGAINIGSGGAGPLDTFRGEVSIVNSTISNNKTLNTGTAASGGGISSVGGRYDVTLVSCPVTGNQTSANSGSHGGGINVNHSGGGTVEFVGCTISNNISGSDGGGVMMAGVNLEATIVAGSLTGNTAQGTGGDANGGGMLSQVSGSGGSTLLLSLTITNNVATAGANARGGAIEDRNSSPMNIRACTISGNSSDNGGGVATTNAASGQLTTINQCTISGNSATTAGGGLFVSAGLLTATFNRIVNNTAPSGSGIAQTGGTASVENNWWGCDGFPGAAGCETGSGTFDADPRIDLRLLPASATLPAGGTQTFRASVGQNTNGVAINPMVLNGLNITFDGGALGTVSPGSAALADLSASTVFTAGSTCSSNPGNVSATLDNGTQTSSVTVPPAPGISACPANQTVNTDAGTCTALVSFTPPTLTGGCPRPTVTCRIGATPITSPHAFPVGTSTVTCTASNGVEPDASCSFTVTVNDHENPSISCPANITVTENPLGSGSAVVNYTAPVGTDVCPGATTVQVQGLPSGSAFPAGVTVNTFRVTDAAGNSVTCSFNVTVTQPPDLTVTKSHTGDFTQGQTGAIYTLTVTNAGPTATSGAVTLTDNVPAGLVATAAAGPGWICGISPAVSCTRSDALAGGASYPPVVLTVNVDPDAPVSVTNTATIAGGGDLNTANNTAMDVTTIQSSCVISCPSNITVPNDPGQCGAIVNFSPTVTGNCGAVGCTPASGSFFPVGTTTVTCGSGTGRSCSFTVTVTDTERPQITLNPATIQLWPPNHSYQTVRVAELVTGVTDNCDRSVGIGNVVIAGVSSDEPENSGGDGDGNTVNDIVMAADCKSVQLRRERDENLNGRVYTIVLQVKDVSNNVRTVTKTVTVPINQSGLPAQLGPGTGYSVTSSCGLAPF
jgi:CSLREA domain-containing protein